MLRQRRRRTCAAGARPRSSRWWSTRRHADGWSRRVGAPLQWSPGSWHRMRRACAPSWQPRRARWPRPTRRRAMLRCASMRMPPRGASSTTASRASRPVRLRASPCSCRHRALTPSPWCSCGQDGSHRGPSSLRRPPDRRTPPCRCLRESRRRQRSAKLKSPRQPTNVPRRTLTGGLRGARRNLCKRWTSHHDHATTSQGVRGRRIRPGILNVGITACPYSNFRMNRRRNPQGSRGLHPPTEGDAVTTQIVILAAGMGSRLGRSLPKPLTELSDGRTIMGQQFDNIEHAFGRNASVTLVVGYKLEHIIEAFPQASFVYNEEYDQTNTSKSLMRALQASQAGGVLWMNGDVVFDPRILDRALPFIARDQSFVTVNTAKVSDEEVKYTTTAEGYIKELSKTVKGGLGEAVGINYVSSRDKATLLAHLARVGDQDYFERGIELAIEQNGMLVEPMDISDLYAVEIDFAEDLERANHFV